MSHKTNSRDRNQNIIIKRNASDNSYRTCASKSRQYIWISSKWNTSNCSFFSFSKENYTKSSENLIKSVWISKHTETDTIFMNPENSSTSEPHQQVLNPTNKLILKSTITILHHQILVSTAQEKYQKVFCVGQRV